ncbi:Peptidase dimerisation domain-containing protein [Dethiosulfatibacter aminovorans DSM 17477]|uniref:Peptidase dimerisation domain-containing protein n=2 Tax=Dethiosulfatibacter TaxID=448125 RepID=A0A1M6BVV5_9FIRM|nr:Peptidase dimerisation domain-containing protein [Dethiosulfatibacter aminovorans DSM 17477]
MKEYLRFTRRELHMYPEVRFELDRTCGFVKQELESIGLVADESYGISSVTALLAVDKSFKTLGLRADMDALDITEISDKEYKSRIEGKMHACGHDVHTAMLLGAAKALVENKDKLKYNVRFIFQSSEEGPDSGAKHLVEDGIMDDVDMIFGMHVSNQMDTGTAGMCIGNAAASATRFSIEVTGKGGHAGTPHLAIDAIAMSARIINDIQHLVAREMNPFNPLVVNVGTISGGSISNGVAENVNMTGTIRTFSKDTAEYLKNRIETIVKTVTESCGGTYKTVFNDGLPPVINEKGISMFFADKIKAMIGDDKFIFIDEGMMGSEDFSYYLTKKPGSFIWLGTGSEEKNIRTAHHDPRFDIDEEAMMVGVEIFKNLAMQE